MSENRERLPPDNSTECKCEELSENTKQRMYHTTELARLLASLGEETSDQDKVTKFKAIRENLMNPENLDPEWGLYLFSLRKILSLYK